MSNYPPRYFSRLELCRSKKAIELKIDNEAPHELNTPLSVTMAGLERVRAFLRFPIRINSAFRCEALNKAVGGSKNSQHMKGEAVDFTSPAYGTHEDVFHALRPNMAMLGIDQLILEPGWVHMAFTLSPRYEVLVKTDKGYSIFKSIG